MVLSKWVPDISKVILKYGLMMDFEGFTPDDNWSLLKTIECKIVFLRIWHLIQPLKRMNKKNTDNLILIIGQSLMLIGFTTFIINYFVLDNNTLLVFVIILLFVISMGFNLKYLINKIKKTKEWMLITNSNWFVYI